MKKTSFHKNILFILSCVLLFVVEAKAQELYTVANAANPNNEANTVAGWSGNALEESVSTDSFHGNYNLKFTAPGNGYYNSYYEFPMEIGEQYTIKIRAKSSSTNNPGFYLWNGFSDFSGRSLTSTNWTEYTFVLTANDTTGRIRVYPGSAASTGDTIFVDNISIMGPDTLATTGPSVWSTGSNNAITYNDGNVGIGQDPGQIKLRVNGRIRAKEVIAVETGGSYKIAIGGINDSYISGKNAGFDQKFYVASNGITYFNGGNVGIGTSNPGTWKLAVNGKIRAKEIKVETGWADYVFAKDYGLPTLADVEKHIKEKGHLINIPSAQEVKKNGILLGEMNKLLLEKIEELTLYTIQQEQKIKTQEERLAKIEALLSKENK